MVRSTAGRLLGLLAAIGLVTALDACATAFNVVPGPGGALLAPSLNPAAPPEPANLRQAAGDQGEALPRGGWTRAASVHLAFEGAAALSGQRLLPEVEVRPFAQPFQDVPTQVGEPVVARGPIVTGTVVTRDLRDGERYHWQARFSDAAGRSGPWLAFGYSSVFDFGVVRTGPPPPSVRLDGAGDQGATTNQRDVTVRLAVSGHPAGIGGYAYVLSRSANVPVPETVNVTGATIALHHVPEGRSFLHVRAVDTAGNWGEPARVPITVDVTAPSVGDAKYSEVAFNPLIDKFDFEFTISKPGTVRVVFYPQDGSTPVRTLDLGQRMAYGLIRGEWDGKDDRGGAVAPGAYRFEVLATDAAGNLGRRTFRDVEVSNKRIVVSLGQQRLWAYEGDKEFISTLVTTGGPELPTPVGTFHILSRQSPFTFRSPWPKGSPYWYPDSPASFAMLFEESGYFIHDSPWRSQYGPGSNRYQGRPGGNGTGTHGCVNVPYPVQKQLFAWAPVGTPVVVQE